MVSPGLINIYKFIERKQRRSVILSYLHANLFWLLEELHLLVSRENSGYNTLIGWFHSAESSLCRVLTRDSENFETSLSNGVLEIKAATLLNVFLPMSNTVTGKETESFRICYWNKQALCGATETASVIKALLSLGPVGSPGPPTNSSEALSDSETREMAMPTRAGIVAQRHPFTRQTRFPRGEKPYSSPTHWSLTPCSPPFGDQNVVNGLFYMDYILHTSKAVFK